MYFHEHAWLGSTVLSLVLLLGAESAGAQIRTVLVSPVPGNPIASGTALKSALAGIPSPSATNPWLLKIEPGIYDVGSTLLQMRSWVDIEGSGIGVTIIRGSVTEFFSATIHGANNAELRLLTVESTSTSTALAMVNDFASPRLYRVKFVASMATSSGAAWGIRNINSVPLIEECEILVNSMGSAYGLVFRNDTGSLPAGRTSILGSRIVVSGAVSNYGVYMSNAQFVKEIRDSRVDVVGGITNRGLYALIDGGLWDGEETLQIWSTEILSSGGSSASYGIDFGSFTSIALDVHESKVWGVGSPSTYGIWQRGEAPVTVQGSWVIGFTQTIQSEQSASIASTVLQGGPANPPSTAVLTQSVDVVGHGDVGIGTAVPMEKLHVFESADANSMLVVENPHLGSSAAGVLRAKSDAATVNLAAHGSGRTLSRFGQVLGGWSELLQFAGNGLILGTHSSQPLILGTNNTNRFHITSSGSIGVGTSAPASLFHVSGGDVRVTGGSFIDDGITLNAPDYVFEPGYSLKTLAELKAFIDREKHLPNIPSAAEIKVNGLRLGQFQMLLLEKVEELTLYAINQDAEVQRLRARNAELEKHFEDRLSVLERALDLPIVEGPQ